MLVKMNASLAADFSGLRMRVVRVLQSPSLGTDRVPRPALMH